jgi:hypothetical protein
MSIEKLEELRYRLNNILEEGQKLKIETQNYIYKKSFSYSLKEQFKSVKDIRMFLELLKKVRKELKKIRKKKEKIEFSGLLTKEAEAIVNEILRGKNPIDIVIEYGLPPDEVKKLYRIVHGRIVHGQLKRSILSVLSLDIPDDILVLFVLASVITALDIITTRVALLHPNAYELNPAMNYLMATFGTEYALLIDVVLSLLGLVALTILSVRSLRGYVRYVPLVVYSALRLIPVVSNYKILLHLFS